MSETKTLETVFVRVLLQNSEVGKVIGKGGAIVQQLKAKSGAAISISDYSRTMPRIATVSGPLDNLVDAITMIAQVLNTPSNVEEKTEESNEDNDEDEEFKEKESGNSMTVTLLVPQSQVGSIIGRGGGRINGIRQSTGATIQISDDYVDRGGNTIRIQGTEDQLTDAVRQVSQLIRSASQRNPTLIFGLQNMSIGGGMANGMHGVQNSSQSSPAPMPRNNAPVSPMTTSYGSTILPPFQSVIQGGSASLFSSSLPISVPTGQSVGRVPTAGGGIRTGGGRGGASPVSASIKVVVAVGKTGILIGRKGVNIERIKAQSGATVSVSDYVKGAESRTATIRSTNVEAIQKALGLILCTLDSNTAASSITLAVPPASLGSVIGRKGSRIQGIRQTTGATIQIEKDGIIHVSGPQLNVWTAGSVIVQHLFQHQQRTAQINQSSDLKLSPPESKESSPVNHNAIPISGIAQPGPSQRFAAQFEPSPFPTRCSIRNVSELDQYNRN